ncbi:MAG: mandelate racemase/muconate lactonizing enzyme family protein [Fimbriimonadaceae bacterium]|nr:mandelate racemase/muconate lactonizing enzyme family protein [Fimbriimonadaceae bacterium]
MKITAVRTVCLSRLHQPEEQWITAQYRCLKADAAVVVIETDSGLQGFGEACAYGGPTRIAGWVEFLAPELCGADPADPTLAPHPNGRDWAYDTAVAGIDCALWDLRAKIRGCRVVDLLTADPPDRVRLYASSGCRYDWRRRPEQLVEETVASLAAGYTAAKFRIGTDWSWDGVDVDRFLGLVRDVHAAVGGRLELMVDGNCRLTEEQALPIARELDRLGFAWFEEPLPLAQIEAYGRLNAAVAMPISGGETFTTVEQFRPYLERRALDIVQPDVGICGLTEAVRIAQVAARYGVGVAPHSWHNGLMALANGSLVASLAQQPARPLELCLIQGPLQWGLLADPPTITDGYLHFPAGPGLGATLAADVAERFPYLEGHYAVTVQR